MSESDHRKSSFTERARSVLSSVQQDDRVKQAAGVTRQVAQQAQEASKTVTRKVSQEDAWDQLRSDVEQLTEIARADHALVVDLLDRVDRLEKQAGIETGVRNDS